MTQSIAFTTWFISPRGVLLFRSLFLGLSLFSGAITACFSQGNIMIIPKRVVFEGSLKSQDLTVANVGNDTSTYVVSLVGMKMNDDGSFDEISTPEAGQFFADPYLRFYPRTVKIGPKNSQVVKMQYLKSSKIAPGEYRSHIYFRAVPNAKPLAAADTVTEDAPVSAKLVPVFGLTIPVIIRVGESNTTASLSDLSFNMVKDSIPTLKMTFNRQGNFSIFGNLEVNYISDQGKITRVAIVKGIAVYTPNLIRRFQCTLDKIPGVDYKSGKLQAVFSTPVDTKKTKLAEAELLLN